MKQKSSRNFLLGIGIILFVAVFLFGFTTWMVGNFGDVSFEQYYFSITAPTSGTPLSFYIKIGLAVGVIILTATILTYLCALVLRKSTTDRLKGRKIFLLGLAGLLCVSSLIYTNARLKIAKYFLAEETTFYEDNYVKPTSNILRFPEKKKNLIYIYLESYEATYFSEALGGFGNGNFLPNLTALLEEPRTVSFSHTDKYGGALPAPETGYSIAAMFAQQSGLPFKVAVDGNTYGTKYEFVPGAITLGDILAAEAYNREFLVGADGAFAGVNNFYQTHGDFNILDYNIAKEKGLIPENYFVWWGFEDSKLFEFSRNTLDTLAQDDKPFALILEADDSHFPDGYTDASCLGPTFKEPYESSIACVDKMVTDFVKYVQAQPYYQDTVIVIQGDHLSMEQNYFKNIDIDPNYQRTTFNAYINVDETLAQTARMKNRQFYVMDTFPTILGALNVEIAGDRLGLGTNLFSETPTLYEEKGVDVVNAELAKRSRYFFDEFLFGRNKYE